MNEQRNGAGYIAQNIINGIEPTARDEPTAFETLKAWCEKYCGEEYFEVVPRTRSYYASIIFNDQLEVVFADNGAVLDITDVDSDTEEHLNETCANRS